MQERSPLVQVFSAFLVAVVSLAVISLVMWFVNRVDSLMLGSSPPLPTGVTFLNSYILTLLVAVGAVVSGAVTVIAAQQAKYFTKQFSWLVYFLVAGPLIALLLMPLERGGYEPFFPVPGWLLATEGRAMVGAALGGLLFGGVDIRRIMPNLVMPSSKPEPRVSNTAVRGLPGRFTPNAWRALSYMQEEAQRFEHAYMGTEHLLLGLLRDNKSQAVRVLINLGAEPAGIRTQLEGVIGRRGSLFTGGTGMTRRCQRVIEGGARIARTSGERTVSTGHLLQALVESPEDMAGQMLDGLGVTADKVSAELRHMGPEGD